MHGAHGVHPPLREECFALLWLDCDLSFFFVVVGGDALRLHFPPVCGRGTARDGLRTEGRVGSERKLHSSPVHNVAVWACIFVSFCAEKKRKALVRHQLPPRTSKATAFHSV